MADLETAPGVIRSDGSSPQARIARILRQRGTLSRAEISRLTGLAKSTVSEAVAELKSSGVVVDAGTKSPPSGRQGRPRIGVMLNPDAGTCIGLDFGLRTVRAIATDVSHTILATRSIRLVPDYSVDEGFEAARALTDELILAAEIPAGVLLGVGAAVAGLIDQRTGTVVYSSMVKSWSGMNIVKELSEFLGYPVMADNDGNCAALAESMWGAGQNASSFAYLKLFSGVGGGVILDHRLLRGAFGAAGDIGHIIVDPHGPLCLCGKRGCLETYAGIPALLGRFYPRFGPDFSFGDLTQLLAAKDLGCLEVMRDTADVIGRVLAGVCSTINPERVVIGGAIGDMFPDLVDEISAGITRYSHSAFARVADTTPVVVAGALGNNASALGAVGLILTELSSEVSVG